MKAIWLVCNAILLPQRVGSVVVQSKFRKPKAEAVIRRCSAKKGVLKVFTKFAKNRLYQSLYFHKVAHFYSVTLLKRSSDTDVFL